MRRIQPAAPVPGTRKACAKVQRWARAATRMRCVGLFTCPSLVCHPVINLVPGTCLVKCSRWKEGRRGDEKKRKKKEEGEGKQGRTKREDREGGLRGRTEREESCERQEEQGESGRDAEEVGDVRRQARRGLEGCLRGSERSPSSLVYQTGAATC